MTSTQPMPDATWAVFCRCPFQASDLPTQYEAHKVGDAHLAETNAPDAGPDPEDGATSMCADCGEPIELVTDPQVGAFWTHAIRGQEFDLGDHRPTPV